MAVGDKENNPVISGTGDVLELKEMLEPSQVATMLAAGKVLMETEMNAEQLAKKL